MSHRFVLLVLVALLVAAAPAKAAVVTVNIVGPGRVVDTNQGGLINCTASESATAATTTTCVATYGVLTGLYLQTSVPSTWGGGQRFVRWDQPGNGEIACDVAPLVSGACTFGDGFNTAMYVTAIFADTTAPQLTLSGGPSGRVNSSAATFSLSSPDHVASFQCNRDNTGYVGCGSSVSYSSLAQGNHTLTVRAVDPSGNVGLSSTRNWSVDTIAPTMTITGGPGGIVNTTTATFSFSSDDPTATTYCRLDSGSFSVCSSPITYPNLADGLHTISVFGNDGLQGGLIASHTWTVDSSLPETTLLTQPAAATSAAADVFTFQSSLSGGAFQCRLDGPGGHDWAACTSPRTYTNLPEGVHIFAVRALSTAATPDPSPSQFTFVVDRTAPDTTIAGDATSGFVLGASEAVVTYACSVDGAPSAACRSPFVPAADLPPGGHTLDVTATDAAGNADATPARVAWVVAAPLAVLPAALPLTQAVAPAPAPATLSPLLVFTFTAHPRYTVLRSLSVNQVPAGGTVSVTCKRGCSAKSFTQRNAKSSVSLKRFIAHKLNVGTVITVTVAKPGAITSVKTLTIRAKRSPLVATRCLPAGAKTPQAC